MSSNTNQGSFCKTLCWVLGIAVGGYTAYALSTDFQVSQIQSGVLGIVTALLVGLILRRILCRGNSNRLRKRLAETPVQSEKEASAVMASAAAKVAAANQSEKPLDSEPEKPEGNQQANRTKAKANGKTKTERRAARRLKAKKLNAPEVAKIDDKLVQKVESATPAELPDDEFKQGKDTPLKLSPVLEVAPDTPGESEISTQDELPEELVISGDYSEDELSDATKAVIAQIVPVVDTPAPDVQAPVEVAAEDMPEVEITQAADEVVEAETVAQEIAEPTPEAEPITEPEETPRKIKPLEPNGLEEPENGSPDELEQIDGIGEDQIAALHKAGIYHFTQFVTMNRRELAWLDDNIPGGGDDAAGNWRKQAIQLSRKAS
jgi:predicted flap endonuclease-1-like 5' DNA nuclease